MREISNFSAGPGQLPERVLQKIQKDLFNVNGSGISAMEMSHRSKHFEKILEDAKDDLRKLMRIPENYEILFLQGGASGQFAAIPMNLGCFGAYVDTGVFAHKAYSEAKKIFQDEHYTGPYIVASSKDSGYKMIPDVDILNIRRDTDYVHLCYNNTVYGTRFNEVPDFGGIPIVADMSSFILSERIDVSKFGVIYAGAQKNLGIAGLTVVIVRKDLLNNERSTDDKLPSVLNWSLQSSSNSMYNTPPCWSIYVAGLVFRDLIENWDMTSIKQHNQMKSRIVYEYIDESKLYQGYADPQFRSQMNVTFSTGLEALDDLFCTEAEKEGLIGLRGHRKVKGIRASLYNGVDYHDAQRLVKFMRKFEEENSYACIHEKSNPHGCDILPAGVRTPCPEQSCGSGCNSCKVCSGH